MSEALTNERWLPVVGFEGLYEVSDHGRVRSVDRVQVYERVRRGSKLIAVTRHLRGQMLRPGTVESGHQLVVLGRGNSRLIHALVLSAFVGPRPPGYDSLHGDGDPGNNRLTNLRWGTRSENLLDSVRHGTHRGGPKPGRSPNAKLSAEQIPQIRSLLAAGQSCPDIARGYGVTPSAIALVKSGRNWGHIPTEMPA